MTLARTAVVHNALCTAAPAVARALLQRIRTLCRAPGYAVLLVAAHAPVAAQVPPPVRDTLQARDTTAAQDTIPADTAAQPAVLFPAIPFAGVADPIAAVWVWDREALLREAPVSLIDLLNRIPGVAAFRAGMFLQPEAASALGGTAGRIEIERDGFMLDPLAAATLDLSQIPLGHLREVRVERRLGLLRIRMLTDQPTAGEPYSRVEAGIGQPPANLFRGIVLVPRVAFGPLGVAVERMDTDGFERRAPADIFSGWAKWAWTDGRRGIQLELVRSTQRREAGVPWTIDRVRQDLVLRARNEFLPGLVAEAYAGRSSLEEKPFRSSRSTDEQEMIQERDVTQAGARVAFNAPVGSIGGALRYRNEERLPQTEFSLAGTLDYGFVSAAADLNRAGWRDGTAATAYDLHAALTAPFGGSVFAAITGGTRGAPDYAEDATSPILTDRSGWRAGAGLRLGTRASGSIALLNIEQDRTHPFGLPFDSAHGPSLLETARGFEASGRLVLVPRWGLAVQSWFTNWDEAAGWTYLPVRTWRTILESHSLPLPSGNLEILARLEGMHRSGILAYNPEPPPTDGGGDYQTFVTVPAHTVFNGYLHIRVIDVRVFLRWEDLLGNRTEDIEDLPGRFHRGPRIFYGVKWNLSN